MAKKMSLLLAVGMLLAASGVAVAQPYPPQACSLSVSDSTVVPGQPITVSGCGFAAGTPVNITFESIPVLLATILAPLTGGDTFATSVIIPNDAPPGAHTVKATGQAADGSGTLVLSAPVQVAGAGTDTGTGAGTTSTGAGGGTGDGASDGKGSGGGLARTGSDSTVPLVQIGVAMVLLGLGTVAVVHRRRNTGRRSRPSEAL